jgi:hypothetical protein
MASSKMNSITDPLAQQKTAAANIGLNNYQTASGNVPQLQGVANNLGQSQQQTLSSENPLFQDIYGQLEKDTSGTGGPYSALTQNLLGSFDTQQNNTQQQLQQQLQAQGLGGSGAGMAVLGNQGVQAAQARAGLVDQNQVNELSMADQLAQQLAQQNQLQGFTNPMTAEQQIQSLSSPPNFQSPETTYYTPGNETGQIWNDVMGLGLLQPQTGGNPTMLGSTGGGGVGGSSMPSLSSSVAGQLMNAGYNGVSSYLNGLNSPSSDGNGAPMLGIPTSNPGNYYSAGDQSTQSMMNNPQLLMQLAMMMGGGG